MRDDLIARLRAFAEEGDGRFEERPYCDDYEGLTQALRDAAAALTAQGETDRSQPIANTDPYRSEPIGGPIPLNVTQAEAVKAWAADDRLWTTQETVEFNLKAFARKVLAAQGRPPMTHDLDHTWRQDEVAPITTGIVSRQREAGEGGWKKWHYHRIAVARCGHVIAATYGTKCQLPICAGDREYAHTKGPR